MGHSFSCSLPIHYSKAALRRHIRRQRSSIGRTVAYPDAFRTLLLEEKKLWHSPALGGYAAMPGEPDCDWLWQSAWYEQVPPPPGVPLLEERPAVLLPRLEQAPEGRSEPREMAFYQVRPGDTLQTHPRLPHLREPDALAPLWSEALDLLLVPALAMDGEGYRLGYGGGYYDRWLATQREAMPGLRVLGVCWQAFLYERLPRDPWDVPLDGYLTEAGLCWLT